MKNSSHFRNLVKELGRDPRLKPAIAKARRHSRGKGAKKVEDAADTVLLLMGIASRFAKKKKARVIDELMDVIYLLVQVSLLLKENIFDRPEVREFFSRSSKQIYLFAQSCVDMVLPKTKTKALRPGASVAVSMNRVRAPR